MRRNAEYLREVQTVEAGATPAPLDLELERAQDAAAVKTVLAKLKEDEFSLFVARWIENKTFDDIAAARGGKAATVRKQWMRLRQKLRNCLKKDLRELIDGDAKTKVELKTKVETSDALGARQRVTRAAEARQKEGVER